MAVQKTFTLIPQTPGLSANPSGRPPAMRPMTSNQVRKAYKAANRAPPMSKAERLRQDRAEQERIRKEFEKEKSAAKARAAREKKREKEMVERNEKKRKGLPLVSVRPSQDTIARFVRGNGYGKKRDCAGRDVAPATVIPAIQEEEGEEEKEKEKEEDEEKQEEEEEKRLEEEKEVDKDEGEQKREKTSHSHATPPFDVPLNDDDWGSEILQDDTISKQDDKQPSRNDATTHGADKILDSKPEQKALQELDLILEEDDLEQEMSALETTISQGNCQTAATRKATSYETDLGLDSKSPCLRRAVMRGWCPIKHPDQKPSMPPPPPHLPPPPRQRQRSASPISPIAAEAQSPPLSTQVILFNVDDFFPTSSQQARELEEETEEQEQEQEQESTPRSETKAQPPALEPKPGLSSPLRPSPSSDSSTPKKRFFTSSGNNERLSMVRHRSIRTAKLEELQREDRSRVEAGEIERERREAEDRRPQEERLARNINESTKVSGPIGQQQPRNKAAGGNPEVVGKWSSSMHMKKDPPAETTVARTSQVEASKRATPPFTTRPSLQQEKKTPSSNETHLRITPPKQAAKQTTTTTTATTTMMTFSAEEDKENIPPQPGCSSPSASQETDYDGQWVEELEMDFLM